MKHKCFCKRVIAYVFSVMLLAVLCACEGDNNNSPSADMPSSPSNVLPVSSELPASGSNLRPPASDSDLIPSPDSSPVSTPITPSASPSPSDSVPRALTDAELAQLTEAFHYPFTNPELICFLTCVYSKPSEVDPNEVFYNGAGGFTTPTDEQKDWLAANGYGMPADWREHLYPDGTYWDDIGAVFLSPATMDNILQRRLGINLGQVEIKFVMNDPHGWHWEWVDKYGVYFTCRTDINIAEPDFISGQYIGNDTYVVDYSGWMDSGDGTYRVTFVMKNNDTDTIRFISNVKVS